MDVRQKELMKKIALTVLPKIIEGNVGTLTETVLVDKAFAVARYFVETADALDYE